MTIAKWQYSLHFIISYQIFLMTFSSYHSSKFICLSWTQTLPIGPLPLWRRLLGIVWSPGRVVDLGLLVPGGEIPQGGRQTRRVLPTTTTSRLAVLLLQQRGILNVGLRIICRYDADPYLNSCYAFISTFVVQNMCYVQPVWYCRSWLPDYIIRITASAAEPEKHRYSRAFLAETELLTFFTKLMIEKNLSRMGLQKPEPAKKRTGSSTRII